MFYAGIDWADQKHEALVLDEANRKLGAIRVAHSPEGLAKLDAWLAQMLGQQNKDQMACIIETKHGLLIAFLLEHGWPVYPVNPRTVDRKRSASGAKTDTIDAYLLAKTGRADLADLHRLTPDSEQVAELKLLTRDQSASQARSPADCRAAQAALPGRQCGHDQNQIAFDAGPGESTVATD